MRTTRELLNRALEVQPAKFWCERYFIRQATLSAAKKRGHLSPALAGNLAIDLGLDARHWMAVAATETERDSPMNDRLRKMLQSRNL